MLALQLFLPLFLVQNIQIEHFNVLAYPLSNRLAVGSESKKLFRRQVFDIDLNEKPPPDPTEEIPKHPKRKRTARVIIYDEAPKHLPPVQNQVPPRYSVKKSWTPMSIPEGLTPEERILYRKKLKNERRKRWREGARASNDSKVVEKYKNARRRGKAKEMDKRRKINERVKNNQGTPEEVEWVAKQKSYNKNHWERAGRDQRRIRRQLKRMEANKQNGNSSHDTPQ